MLLDLEGYWKAMLMNTYETGTKIDEQTNGIEESIQKQTQSYQVTQFMTKVPPQYGGNGGPFP